MISRKEFIELSAKTLAAAAWVKPEILNEFSKGPYIKAIAFDAYTLFDTRSLAAETELAFPGKGTDLMQLWRTRQFEYTWLRCLSKRYKDFYRVTEDALVYATEFLRLDLTNDKRNRLMQAFLSMKFFPESGAVLQSLKDKQFKLAILSNATPAILQAGINHSALQNVFDHVLSTDSIKTYKPDPAAYQLGVDAFKLKKEEILYVAFGGWDASGAKYFGYPTTWINAANLPIEQLDLEPDYSCSNLTELANYVLGKNREATITNRGILS